MRWVFLIVVLLFGFQGAALAIGSPDYLPDGQHPRIWLTSAELIKLNAKQAESDTAWTDLETWCDAHLADAGYAIGRLDWDGDSSFNGYRMSGFNNHLMSFGLAYQVLKDDNPTKAATYAAHVRDILIDGILIGMKSGEENNGLKALRCGEADDRTINTAESAALSISTATYKLGYASRNLAAVPIAYDWIYDTLSSADKTALEAMMFRWYDWIQGVRSEFNNGVLVSGTRYHEDQEGDCTGANVCTSVTGIQTKGYAYEDMAGNFMGGHTYLMSLVPVATYGENAAASGYLTTFKSLLTSTVIDQLEDPLQHSGGDAVEGWNYGGGYIYTLPGLYGYYTGTGDAAISAMTWPDELVTAMVHRLGPNLLDVPIYGDWTGTPLGENRKHQALTFTGIQQRFAPASTSAKLGQYVLDNVSFSSTPDLWKTALWARSDIAAVNPNTEPLAHRAEGNGFVTSRSSWVDAADTVFLSARLEGKSRGDHEGYDEGHISLQRGDDRLLVHQNLSAPSVAHNSIVFNGLSHHAGVTDPVMTETAIDRYENGSGYLYTSADITSAWSREWQTARANLFRRSVLHLRPNTIVVADVTQSNSAVGNLKEWYTQYEADPTVAGDTITVTNGSSKAFVKTLYPAGGAYTETIPSAGFWRVKYTPVVEQEYDQFLTVLEATGSADSQTASTLIDGTGGRGAVIDGTTIAMFTKDQAGGDITSLTYSVDTSGPSTHYIADLTPGATYNVQIDSDTPVPYVASSAGLIVFENPVFSPHDYSIALVGAPATYDGHARYSATARARHGSGVMRQ